MLLSIAIATTSFAAPQKKAPVLLYDLGQEGSWIPYQRAAQRGNDGVFKQVMDAVARKTNISFENVYFPPMRAQKALKDGLVDFDFNVIEWMPNRDYGEELHILSEPLFSVTEFIVALDSKSQLFTDREDYYGKSIGTIAGYFYFDDDKFKRVDFLRENLLLQGLQRGRFDVIIMEKESARYWASTYNMKIAFPVLHTKGEIRIRLRKQKKALMPMINKGIQAIIQNGELEAILLQHGIVEALP